MMTAKDAARFALGGRAVLTIESRRTGEHRTFRVSRPKPDAPYFLQLLSGPDDYTYVGVVDPATLDVRLTAKSRMTCDSVPVRAWRYVMTNAAQGRLPPDCVVRHEGRCAVCARALTVPESLDRGIGPECWARAGGV